MFISDVAAANAVLTDLWNMTATMTAEDFHKWRSQNIDRILAGKIGTQLALDHAPATKIITDR